MITSAAPAPAVPPRDDAPARALPADLVWLDALKGAAMLWIVLNHVVEQIAGGEFAGNPAPGWPPLAARIAQFTQPVAGGLTGALAAIVRDVGWLGDQGVTLFLIASGFGLTFGLLRRDAARVALGPFYRARASRVYPLWLGAHAVLLAVLFATWSRIGPGFVASALGLRFIPSLFFAYVPAWWYVGLLLQLYLVFPPLYAALRRFGPARALLGVGGAALAVRGAGLAALHASPYLEVWARGALFVTRLPEFVAGMCFAAWYAAEPAATAAFVRRPAVRLAAAATFAAGLAASFTLLGMTVVPLAMGAGAFVLLAPVLDRRGGPAGLAWTGRNSYALYLVHQPFITALVPAAGTAGAAASAIRVGAALALTVVGARALEGAVATAARLARSIGARGPAFAAGTALAVAVAGYAGLVAADLAAERFAPLEIDGWGERPSLAPDAATGWKLIPSRITHLRWTSYDYTVRANALGYPGPDAPAVAPPGTLRVFVTGDAFTSGEGVGTDGAWPSLLGPALGSATHRNVSVLNFAITGYGPDQEARVVRRFVPRFRPRVVVFESFVNAFEKLALTDDDIRADIGFGKPPAAARANVLKLLHLRAFLSEDVADVLRERLAGRPSPEDAGFSDASAFVRDDPAFPAEAARYRSSLAAVRAVARANGAALLVVMIPSRAQACAPDAFPRGAALDLHDPRYDGDRPQRTARAAAAALGVPFLDLRTALAAGGVCRYQRRNMHFLEAGDAATAAAVARAIATLPLR